MRVLILHDELPVDARPDELDVLRQVEAVEAPLRAQGHAVSRRPFGLKLDVVARTLRQLQPSVVVNLVETIERSGRLVHLAPSLLDHLRIAYTGCGTAALIDTSDKLRAKVLLRAAGIPTPDWLTRDTAASAGALAGRRFIVKSVWEHGSYGLDESSVVTASTGVELSCEIGRRAPLLGGLAFAEAYVHGREFNIALLEVDGAPVVLPPAEILFEDHAPERPRVLGYGAKWDTESAAYRATPRSFDLGAGDATLLARLSGIALRCWELFGLSGYARVDFRVDGDGAPFVLEVNANPCIAPDAGFVAAAARAGHTYAGVVDLLIAAAQRREETHVPHPPHQ